MTLLSTSLQVSMLRATGAVAVVDTVASESSYGHFEESSEHLMEEGYGAVLASSPSVVVVNGAFTNIGPRKGVDRSVTVGGTSYTIRDILPGDRDGGLLRLMLLEA